MPTASLLLMTSPLLIGSTPTAAFIEPSADAPHSVTAQAAIGRDDAAFPLSWTLAEGDVQQPQSEGPQAPASAEQSANEPPPEDGDDSDDSEIIVQGTYGPPKSDPAGAVNEVGYRVSQEIDNVLIGPVAYAYRDGLPRPLREGLGNVVRNLGEPANFLNYLLQFKIGKAFETLGRFAINSTLGVGGMFDIAKKPGIELPYRRNGFANTLGFYGVGSGAYLYLPIAGATTIRDFIGNTLDQAVLPFVAGAPFTRREYSAAYFVINSLDARLEFDAELEILENTVDPYAARRDTYLARREREIALLRGEEPPEPPAILLEIEEELSGAEEGDDEDLESGEDLSLDFERELPAIASAVTITKPATR